MKTALKTKTKLHGIKGNIVEINENMGSLRKEKLFSFNPELIPRNITVELLKVKD